MANCKHELVSSNSSAYIYPQYGESEITVAISYCDKCGWVDSVQHKEEVKSESK